MLYYVKGTDTIMLCFRQLHSFGVTWIRANNHQYIALTVTFVQCIYFETLQITNIEHEPLNAT